MELDFALASGMMKQDRAAAARAANATQELHCRLVVPVLDSGDKSRRLRTLAFYPLVDVQIA